MADTLFIEIDDEGRRDLWALADEVRVSAALANPVQLTNGPLS